MDDCEILEIPVDQVEEHIEKPEKKARKKKIMTQEEKDAFRDRMAKAREAKKRELMLERERVLLKHGKDGRGPKNRAVYVEDEDNVSKIYRKPSGRKPQDWSKKGYPIVGQVDPAYLSDEYEYTDSDDEGSDDSSEDEHRKRPHRIVKTSRLPYASKSKLKRIKVKTPSIQDQKIDYMERKINDIIAAVNRKKKPNKTTTIINQSAPIPTTMPRDVGPAVKIPSATTKKELKKVLTMF